MGQLAEPLTASNHAGETSNKTLFVAAMSRMAIGAIGGSLYGIGAQPGGWPVVVVALAVFLEATAGAPTLEIAALAGAAWAVAGALVAFTWLLSTGVAVYSIVAVGWGVAGLAAGGALGLVGARSWRYLAAPLVIAGWETLRVVITNGTALAIAPTSLVGTPLVGAAAWVGATGLTVALGALAAAVWGFIRRKWRTAAWLSVGGLILLAPAFLQSASGTPLRVAAVQTWLTNKQKWDPAKLTFVLTDLRRLSVTAARQGATLIVWPETAVPQDPFHDPVARDAVITAARESGAWMIVGTETLVPPFTAAPAGMWRPANLLLLVDPQGQPRGAYTKMHHVPYGEPAEARGAGYRILQWGATPIGPAISWEVFTSTPFRAYARQGAQLVVGPTNSAWAAARISELGDQEIALARVRAAESRLPVVLAANGPAAIIDGRGGVVARGAAGKTEVIVGTVGAGTGAPPSPTRIWPGSPARPGPTIQRASPAWASGGQPLPGCRPRSAAACTR